MFNKAARVFMIGLLCILTFRNIGLVKAQGEDVGDAITVTFEDLGYTDIQLKGLYGTNSTWIPFQSDWAVGDVVIQLTYAASPLLNSNEAILTVLANDQEITSIRPVGDGQNHTVSVTVPPALQLEDGISLTFEGHLRLTDEYCEDSFNTGQWLIVRNTSSVNINMTNTPRVPELTDLPQAIMVQGQSEDIAPVIFVLPDQASDLALTVASQISARLGAGLQHNHLPINIATTTSLMEEQQNQSNLVVIGLPSDQPLIRQLSSLMPVPLIDQQFVSEDGIAIPSGDGVVQIFPSPWRPNGNILVVSGNDLSGLAMAGQAFAHQATFRSLTGSFHFIHSLVTRPDAAANLPWQGQQTSFAQLGQSDRQITGLGITDTFYLFQYPSGVLFGDGAKLVLHVAFSPVLRSQKSYVVAYVNDIYAGAIDVNAMREDSWVALDLPVQALNQWARNGHPRQLDVRFSIANLLPTNNCDQVDKDSSWTKIYADSYFETSFIPVATPDLYFFPYPFVSGENKSSVRFVIPDDPTSSELQAVISVAALLGDASVSDFDLQVHRAGTETRSSLMQTQVILFGTPERNTFIASTLDGAKVDVPLDIYQALKSPQLGFFHMMKSPWDENMSALVVYGDNEDGFNSAMNAIYENAKLVNESGSIAVVRPQEAPIVIYREAGLVQPEVIHPEVIQSVNGEISLTPTTVAPTSAAVAPETQQPSPPSITGTERLILVVTVFLVILVAVGALVRIAWRIRP